MNAHHPFADSTEDTSHRWENPTRTGGVAHRGTLRNRRTPSAFCTKSYIFPRRYLARTSSKEVGGLEPPSVPPKFVMRSRTAFASGNQSRTSFVPLLYHTLRSLSRGLSNFFEKSFRLALSHSYQCLGVCGLLPSPLDALIVSQLGRFVKGFFTFFFDDWDLPSVSADFSYHRTQCAEARLEEVLSISP